MRAGESGQYGWVDLFDGSSRARCGGGAAGRNVAAPGSALGGCDQHGDQLSSASERTAALNPARWAAISTEEVFGEHAEWLRRRCSENPFSLRGLVKELPGERSLQDRPDSTRRRTAYIGAGSALPASSSSMSKRNGNRGDPRFPADGGYDQHGGAATLGAAR